MSDENVLTKEIADQFLADEDSVDLEEFTAIDEDAAESLSKHEGELYLDGLTSLSDAAAESLSKHKDSYLGLDGLTSLSAAAAESLSKHKGDLSLAGLTSLSAAAVSLLERFDGPLLLPPMYAIPELSTPHASPEFLRLICTSEIDKCCNDTLSTIEASVEHLDYEDDGTRECVESAIERFRIQRSIGRLQGTLTGTLAERFIALQEDFRDEVLSLVINLSDEAAQVLTESECVLTFYGLASLSDQAAESLVKHEGDLSFDLDNLPESAAAILRKHASFADEE